jgi:hypothetical protein
MTNKTTTGSAGQATTGSGDGARLFGLGLAAALGVLLVVLGAYSIGDTQPLLTLALFGFGLANLLLGWGAFRGSRGSWAFLVAVGGALSIAYLFGAPTLHKQSGLALGLCMVPAALHALATFALVLGRDTYR